MNLHEIPPLFGIKGSFRIATLSSGHINSTFRVSAAGGEFVLQSLNRSVFREPEAVMGNISAVVRAFSGAENICVPEFLTCGGRNFAEYGGEIWRMYPFAEADEAPDNRELLAGKAFGTFIRLTNDIKLVSVINGYHSYGTHLKRLTELAGCDDLHRIDNGTIARLSALGDELSAVFTPELPKRIIHGDAKLDNIIIGERVTIIDLDTAMESYAALDFGDLIRSVTKNGIDLDRINATVYGFAEGLDGSLGSGEINSLYYGILWSTGELALRYLTDCISGDRYFRDKTPDECLSRSGELLKQLESFNKAANDIKDIISSNFRKK